MSEPNSPGAHPLPLATTHVIEHAEATDLPESNWAWRRLFIFLVTAALLSMVWWVASRLSDVDTLRMTIRNDQWLIGLAMLLYIAGASSEAITKLVGAIRTTRKETVTTVGDGGPLPPGAAS